MEGGQGGLPNMKNNWSASYTAEAGVSFLDANAQLCLHIYNDSKPPLNQTEGGQGGLPNMKRNWITSYTYTMTANFH
jgi:hypothetical protein